MLIAPHITTPHGFSTRNGGMSHGVYAAADGTGGLNMDSRSVQGVQDDPAVVQKNRQVLLAALGGHWQLSLLDQIHSDQVIVVTADKARCDGDLPAADAQVTQVPGVLLGIMTADCFPVLLHDPVAGVVGSAHAGWRGTAACIAARTVEAMQRLGAQPQNIQAAVGVGICAAQYPVGDEVVQALETAGLGEYVRGGQADLSGANAATLARAGVAPEHIWQVGRCSTNPEFYSYRRDQGRTGRMLAVIGLRA